METVTTTVIGTRNNGTKIVRNQITNRDNRKYNELAHAHFTKEDRIKAEAEHKILRKERPFIFNEQRNNFLRAIVDSKEINLNISKISLT